MEALTIYNLPVRPPNWDRIGIFFVTFAAVWTTAVACGMAFCLYNRDVPALRVRSLPLAFGGIVLLHMYWCLAQIVYPIGATMPVVVAHVFQYFVMGIWFPLGIALFHAANFRFLRVAELQKQFESTSPVVRVRSGEGNSARQMGWKGWWGRVKHDDKIMVLIGIGMVFQVILTTGMWAACRKYHPGFGVEGTEIKGGSLPEQVIELSRGWEWWPSVMWQFVWTWMVAPFLIWRAWSIRDTLGWRAQTIGACVSGLHATPMFLIASYTPIFYTSGINSYFPPSQWIHLNTMFIEIFTIFLPAWQVVKHWRAQRLAASAASKWETSSVATTLSQRPQSRDSASKCSTKALVDRSPSIDFFQSGDRLLTMSALTKVLTENPAPLQDFSARHDFSGENIAFLTRLAQWKAFTPVADRRCAYDAALRLYIDFVSPRDADFPLNLSSSHLVTLQAVFETQARSICGNTAASPCRWSTGSFVSAAAAYPMLPCFEAPQSAQSAAREKYQGDVPEAFDESVFDDAKAHVEALVLTNTWPRFVKFMQAKRRTSVSSEESRESTGSKGSKASKASKGSTGSGWSGWTGLWGKVG